MVGFLAGLFNLSKFDLERLHKQLFVILGSLDEGIVEMNRIGER